MVVHAGVRKTLNAGSIPAFGTSSYFVAVRDRVLCVSSQSQRARSGEDRLTRSTEATGRGNDRHVRCGVRSLAIALAFQARETGSIPVRRSIPSGPYR